MERWELYWIKFLLDESQLKPKEERTDADYTMRPGLYWDSNGSWYYFIKLTTTKPRDKTEYAIEDWEAAGLSSPTTIRCKKVDDIRVAESGDLVKEKIGKLSPRDIQKIKSLRLLVESQNNEGISEEEMKKVICSMINQYDASEEEVFDELQVSDPKVSRDLVHRLYQMCNKNKKTESIEESFDDYWNELEELDNE